MAKITILNANNVPQGPFTRSEVAQRLQSGEFTPSSLAFIEGLGQWTPLRDVLARVDAAEPPTAFVPPPVTMPAPAVQPYSYAATMQPPSHLIYAGFWLRFVAYMLDSFIIGAAFAAVLMVIGFIIGIVAGVSGKTFHAGDADSTNMVFGIGIALVEFVVWILIMGATWLYFAMQESGPAQATLGKRALGLRVTSLSGERINFGQASGRFFGKIVSGLTFYVGFIMAGFTEKKQALHDMLAGTLVVRE